MINVKQQIRNCFKLKTYEHIEFKHVEEYTLAQCIWTVKKVNDTLVINSIVYNFYIDEIKKDGDNPIIIATHEMAHGDQVKKAVLKANIVSKERFTDPIKEIERISHYMCGHSLMWCRQYAKRLKEFGINPLFVKPDYITKTWRRFIVSRTPKSLNEMIKNV